METTRKAGPEASSTWSIERRQDLWESVMFQRSLYKRLVTRTTNVASRLGESEALQALSTLPPVTGHVWTDPDCAWLGFKGLVNEDEEFALRVRVRRAMKLLQTYSRQPEPPALGYSNGEPPAEWLEQAISEQTRELWHDTGADPHLTLGSAVAPEAEQRMQRAVHWMQTLWPEAAEQVGRLVRVIVWVSAPKYWSATAPYAYGAVFINPTERWTVPYFLDTLLHETGHLSLMIKQSIHLFLENPLETATSPLRDDPRTLNGILHAAFSLKRICHGLTLYVNSDQPVDNRGDAAALLGGYSEKLRAATETLRKQGRFTPPGLELLQSLTGDSYHGAGKSC